MWRISSLTAAIGALALAGLAADDALAHKSFCSIDPFGGYTNKAATLFIGVATADSLPGGAPVNRGPGPLGRDSLALAAPPWSQVVTIERLSTSAPTSLAKAISRNSERVLLIPWVYGPDCSPGTWTGSALWMEPGTRGFFSGVLRPKEKWVGDVPTFDVGAPFNLPYPSSRSFERYLRGGPPLTADELMSLYDSLPRWTFERTDRLTSLKREQEKRSALIDWGERHPGQANRPPLAAMLTAARRESSLAPYYLRSSPLAGTWHFTVELPGQETVTMYGRTQERATTLLASHDGKTRIWELDGAAPFGYSMLMVMTRSIHDLDIPRWPPPQRQGYLPAAFEPELVTPDSMVWGASAELFGAQAVLPESPGVRKEFAHMRIAARAFISNGRPQNAPGRIITKPDGSARLELVYRDINDVVATIRGERVSTTVWNPR